MVKKSETVQVTIPAPNMQQVEIVIEGTTPLMIARFSKKAELMAKMAEGPSAKNKKDRKARDYDAEAHEAKHISEDGWEGVAASSFRAACISACRLVGFKMTLAKLSIFIVADGIDREEQSPLVRIYGESITNTAHTRNATGVVDIRARPMYKKWACLLKVKFDANQFNVQDVCNLVSRVGLQVGVGEGRPDSKASAGLGYGLFEVVEKERVEEVKAQFGIA